VANLQQTGGGGGGTSLTGTGIARNTGACTELSGAVTTSGSNATTLVSPASVSEVDANTVKLNIAQKDIILSRSAAASLALTGSITEIGSHISSVLATPAQPVVTPTLGSASTWGYRIVARDGLGASIASTEGTTSTGAATLDGTHFNTITWTAVAGAVSYDIYRTTTATSPTTKGKLGNVLADATLSFVDNAVAGDGRTAPTINTSGVISQAGTGVNAGDGGCMWPLDVDISSIGGTATIICPTGANQVIVWQFVCQRTITIRKVTFLNGTTVVSSTTASFGIYDANGNLLLDSGTFSTAVASQTLVNTLGSPVTLYAGELYYFAQSATNTTVTSATNVVYNSSANTMFIKNVLRHGVATNSVSSGAMPVTLGAISTNGVRTPVGVLFES